MQNFFDILIFTHLPNFSSLIKIENFIFIPPYRETNSGLVGNNPKHPLQCPCLSFRKIFKHGSLFEIEMVFLTSTNAYI